MSEALDIDTPAARVCGYDGAPCLSVTACSSDHSCRREAEMEARNICVQCDTPRQMADKRAFKSHIKVHAELVPCPNNCGGGPFNPHGGLTRHLRTCGLVITSPARLTAVPDPTCLQWDLVIGSSTVTVRVSVDAELLHEASRDRRRLLRLVDLLEDIAGELAAEEARKNASVT